MKIAIIHGGTSTEQAGATRNAEYVNAALSRLGHEAVMINYDVSMTGQLRSFAPDLVWICVQGKGHGDGTIQAMLDFLGLPYTGSRTTGAALINDKLICKELFRHAGIRTPDWKCLSYDDYRQGRFSADGIGYPFVAKALTQGSSFGIELIMSPDDLPKMEEVFRYDDPILIEKFIPGHCVDVGLLDDPEKRTIFLPVSPVLDEDSESNTLLRFGYQSPSYAFRQYTESSSAELQFLAEKAFAATRAHTYARMDFRVSSEDGLPYILEINAVPGLKPEGSYASAAGLCGIDYDTMIEKIIRNSLRDGNRNA
jgi:D-alanine--D-alanine ligase